MAADALPVVDVLDLGEDEYGTSDLLTSEDEEEEDVFITPARAEQAFAAWLDKDEGSMQLPLLTHKRYQTACQAHTNYKTIIKSRLNVARIPQMAECSAGIWANQLEKDVN